MRSLALEGSAAEEAAFRGTSQQAERSERDRDGSGGGIGGMGVEGAGRRRDALGQLQGHSIQGLIAMCHRNRGQDARRNAANALAHLALDPE